KCFYCSFSIFVGKEKHVCVYLDCLEKEIRKYSGEKVSTVYVGGGTPSSLSIKHIKRLFNIIKNNFQVIENAEITFEANPEDISIEKLRLLKQVGVNRLSLGIQTLNDKFLKDIGRGHDRDSAFKAIPLVRKEGFENLNLDMMYGFDGQSNSDLEADIKDICAFESEHLSIYTLTVEKNSKFYTTKVRQKTDDELADQFLFVKKMVKGFGYKQYEISNFAKPGRESKHNLNYWEAGNYIGLGMAAHSHSDGKRVWNVDSYVKYIKMMQDEGIAVGGEEMLSRKERFLEALMFGLRMTKGVNLDRLESQFACKLDNRRKSVIGSLVDGKMLSYRGHHLRATQKGQLVLDEISVRLI
ncbi:MAG: radical SAM family heme chaperone HemW, partial [Candidatus Omnitrophica bacterium]|nr:radical SAM family heme chaperone HemW [Candidatus Omnitrophota bacterium]